MAVSSATGGMSIDVDAIVSGLMSIERRPLDKLNSKETSYKAKITALGLIKSKMAAFQAAAKNLGSSSSSSLLAFKATSSDATIFSATAGSTAVAGNYSLEVTSLAKAQKLAAAGQVSDTSAIATGASTVTFVVGGTSTDVTIAAGATLQDIRNAINSADMGVTATIVNDGSGSPYRLALSADSSGTSNDVSSITVKTGGDAAVNNLLAYNPTENAPAPAPAVPMAQTIAASDAVFKVNGIEITKSSNTVTDAVEGVTLNLSKENASATLTVDRDTAAVSKAVSDFVTAYNDLQSAMKNSYARNSGSALEADPTLRSLQTQMRDIVATAASGGSLSNLFEVGVTSTTGGTLQLDSAKLSSAMAANFGDVASLFNSATGFATRFDSWAKSTLDFEGTFANQTGSLDNSLKSLASQRDIWETRLKSIEGQYRRQFSSLNMTLSSMNQTSTYLTQQLSKL